jgi:protein-S-isoprenylcysteine O-methyltransferase Ste14
VAERGSKARIIEWVSRRRVSAGFLFGAVVLWFAEPTPRLLTVGAAVATIGEAIRVWAAGHLEKGREVTVSGPYAFTRHPLYVGSAFIGAGLAIASASVFIASFIALFLIVTFGAAIRTEEAHLTQKFGDDYVAYREGRTREVKRQFSLERAMRNREYRAIAGLVSVIALLAWKASH